ncbi:tetratricopeptide repeat protein [bacterium]|nr:tetratricopeptide repeat protein [bacterium]
MIMKYMQLALVALMVFSCKSQEAKDAEAACQLGIEALEQGEAKYRDAIRFFNQAIELNPDALLPYYWLANTQNMLNEPKKALATVETAMGNPSIDKFDLKPNLLVIAGVSALKTKQESNEYFNEALEIYEHRIELDPNNFDALMQKCVILCYMNRKNEALQFIDEIPKNAENQGFLSELNAKVNAFNTDSLLNNPIFGN